MRAAAIEAGASAAITTNHHALGGAGAVDLAEAVVKACSEKSEFKFLYDVNLSIKVCLGVVACQGWDADLWALVHHVPCQHTNMSGTVTVGSTVFAGDVAGH